MTSIASWRRARPARSRVAAILFLAVTSALILPVAGCMTPSAPARTPEEMEDVRQTLLSNAQAVERYLNNTTSGQNVSEFSLGWTAYSILVTLSSEDPELYHYFTKDSGDIQLYMKTTFRQHPQQEVDNLEALARQGHADYRLTARYALESLRHIPNGDEPPDAQARDRGALAQALSNLETYLKKSAEAVVAGD